MSAFEQPRPAPAVPRDVPAAAESSARPPGLPPGPVSLGVAALLLDAQPGGGPSGRARLDVLRQAEGDPLTIVELSRTCPPVLADAALVSGSMSGRGPSLRSTPRVRGAYREHLGALPEATRRALLYAAAAWPDDELRTVMAALDSDDLSVWDPAEESGLITVADGRLAFGRPLIRAAAFHGPSAGARQRAHRDLAAASDQSPASRARHLAEASIGPDETVAEALDAAAAGHRLTGDLFAAARALEQAARLSVRDPDRARRLAGALAAASCLGNPEWVRDLYERFSGVNHDPEQRCVAACAMAGALSLLSFQREAFGLLLDAFRQSPPSTAATSFALAALAASVSRQSGLADHRRALPRLLAHADRMSRKAGPRKGRPAAAGPTADGADTAVTGPAEERNPELAGSGALVALCAPPTGPSGALSGTGTESSGHAATREAARLLTAASVAYHTDRSELCAELYRRASGPRGARGALGPTLWELPAQVDTLIALGRWAEAEALAADGRSVAAVHRLPRLDMDLEALTVTLRALRGDPDPDPVPAALTYDPRPPQRPTASRVLFTGPHWRSVSLDENRATRARMLRACGLSALSLGDSDGAYRHFRALYGEDGAPLDASVAPRAIAELAESAARAGRRAAAARVLAGVREGLGDRPTSRMSLLTHHAAALVEERGDPEAHFRLALAGTAGETWPLERARTRLHYAVWLRRRRRPLEARTQLAAALEAAVRLGARGLAGTARGELRAAGAAEAAGVLAPVPRLDELTPQQERIARLAAGGLTNREIGERLFLSPRTVGSHLYQVYPKLGISSRRQLRDVLSGT
ncbi:transcriptional regulator [Streptomyces inusitatus]|uniref:Transcriptional regulator n=1 Tax=Streptomyces inusitatus TaxID=68221 RepID=A0A918QI21_9ACTN|nr:helix-turn-helix transcriptional regulator [Streptomyces inusitatus]GGZ51247.1 transcriptional regulator [Streptomyces inusitatus]